MSRTEEWYEVNANTRLFHLQQWMRITHMKFDVAVQLNEIMPKNDYQ